MGQISPRSYLPQEPVREFLDKSMEHHEKGAITKAEKYYKRVLKIDPNHFQSTFLLGTLEAQKKNLDQAKL